MKCGAGALIPVQLGKPLSRLAQKLRKHAGLPKSPRARIERIDGELRCDQNGI
jgi:hypothetical protein